MSVQVSYKKQTLLGIIGLIIIFSVIEVIANVWWFTQVNCEFEENEIFSQMNDAKIRQLCVDLYEVKTSGMELIPKQESQSITINSLGFRGGEFSVEKPNSVYRIFLLGGSTMFGYGATSDETTIPGYVQEFFQNNYEGIDLQVINAGIQGADSFAELNLIETKLLNYSPNMIIIYDGWNDLREQNSPSEIYNNWDSMCELGKQNEFDVIVALQPIAGFGNKALTKQELELSKSGTDYDNNLLIDSFEKYNEYTKNLERLENCQTNVNLRSVFDNETSPIYWDQGHVSDKGNNLVASALQEKIKQILPENLPKSVQINGTNEVDSNQAEMQIRYLISSYKTPLMFNSIFSFEKIDQDIVEKPKNMIFETQTKIYNEEEISIIIEPLSNEDGSKSLKIKTINKTNDSLIPNVTYFLNIEKDGEMILNDFFYVEGEIFELEIMTINSNEIEIFGERQYAHNAIIADVVPPVKLSGPLFEDNIAYDFNIGLRTLYDPSNWTFSLDGFHVEIIL